MLNQRLMCVLRHVACGASLFSLLLLPGLAFAQQIITSPPQTQAQSSAFWTPQRKAAALPMPLRTVSGAPIPAPAATVHTTRTAGAVPGSLPAGVTPDPTLARVGGESAAATVTPALGPGSTVWYPYPPPFTSTIPILDYFAVPLFPNTTLGKLFFSGPQGNFVCSAQSVTSAGSWGTGNRQTVVTAGHCCSDGSGNFFGNWMFEPAHVNGHAPFGSWSAHLAAVYGPWHNNSDLSLDFCVLQMRTNSGRSINDAVGALGYAWNQPLPQHYVATGWPAAPPFTGEVLFYSLASSAETDTFQAGVLPFTHAIGSPMTGGSSGGAWILKYQSALPGNNNMFNGLNSYGYNNRPAEMFGPYIDTGFVNLLQTVATAPAAP